MNFNYVSKLATLAFLKMKVFCNKGYDLIIFVHNATNKISSFESSYIVDVVMWTNFCNFSISMRDVVTTSTAKGFLEGCSWFKFNSLGLQLGMTLQFYTSVAKGLKLKVLKFEELFLTFVEVTWEKLVTGRGGPFSSPLSWIALAVH